MSRHEFTKPVKREALKRSGGLCESVGPRYGLRPGQRCNAPLSFGVEFDHAIADGQGGDNSLENCVACCTRCHDWKTRNVDVPQIAKMKRQRDKRQGIRGPKKPWPKRPFGQHHGGNARDINDDLREGEAA